MKTIGIIGGMSWESSAHYYAIINRAVRDRLGAPHSAKIVMHSLDFGEIAALQHRGDWDALAEIMRTSALSLKAAEADCILLATNTMHKVATEVEVACELPLLHIADPTGESIAEAGLKRVALLGTAFTMEEEFYRTRLETLHGLEVIIPEADERAIIHCVIYQELVAGDIQESSRKAYRDIIRKLADRGAQGVIMGCTEITLLIDQSDSPIPLFDTTHLHAMAAVEFALSD